jgi:hypothetical protein
MRPHHSNSMGIEINANIEGRGALTEHDGAMPQERLDVGRVGRHLIDEVLKDTRSGLASGVAHGRVLLWRMSK